MISLRKNIRGRYCIWIPTSANVFCVRARWYYIILHLATFLSGHMTQRSIHDSQWHQAAVHTWNACTLNPHDNMARLHVSLLILKHVLRISHFQSVRSPPCCFCEAPTGQLFATGDYRLYITRFIFNLLSSSGRKHLHNRHQTYLEKACRGLYCILVCFISLHDHNCSPN